MTNLLKLIERLNSSLGTEGIIFPFKLLIILVSFKLKIKKTWNFKTSYLGKEHVWYVNDRRDLSALEDTFVTEEYKIDNIDPKTIFDLGANIGDTAVFFAMRYPDAIVHAFEPHPDVFKKLVKNTQVIKNIICHQIAIGSEDGEVDFYIGESHLSSSLLVRKKVGTKISVKSLSLKSALELAKANNISLLKYDIEGGEELLFKNESFEQFVEVAIGEVHTDLITISTEEFISKFKNYITATTPINSKRFILTAKNKSI